MVAVEYRRRLPEHAALADLDQLAALDQNVVGEPAPPPDPHGRATLELDTKAASELDVGTDDEGRALRAVDTESRPKVDRPLEPEVHVPVSQQDPSLPDSRHQARPPQVAHPPRQIGDDLELAPAAVAHAAGPRAWITTC